MFNMFASLITLIDRIKRIDNSTELKIQKHSELPILQKKAKS